MMMHHALQVLFPDYHPGDWELQDDGAGPYIAVWNRAEPQPASETIIAVMAGPDVCPTDWDGFRLYCLGTIMGGNYAVINPLLAQYPCFEMGISHRNSAMLRAEIARARADNVANPANGIDATLEAAILAAATTYHIP